ncbi:hypothetical protein E2C01_101182 [Portunus trituberculatus]|uniref:Ig-like domain-containing protein n=1 Tax=Portunus trituberculatus TaxID=210409 RepID=A0A5B7KJF7_PORTR|nr:hypothetical protein [Portunus trituberculatus]
MAVDSIETQYFPCTFQRIMCYFPCVPGLTPFRLFPRAVPVVEVSGLRGGTVELPCDVSHPPNDEVLLLLWFRDPLTTPIFRSV